MEHVVIDSIEAYERTRRRLTDLLSDSRSLNAAVALAESLVPGECQELSVRHLCAFVYADAGLRLKNSALVQKGILIWSEMIPDDSVTISYNLACAQLGLWQLAVEQAGMGDA